MMIHQRYSLTDRQTDGRTTSNRKTALCTASRGKKKDSCRLQ